MHEASRCDMIVCWEHNWAEYPLEVVELKRYYHARERIGLERKKALQQASDETEEIG